MPLPHLSFLTQLLSRHSSLHKDPNKGLGTPKMGSSPVYQAFSLLQSEKVFLCRNVSPAAARISLTGPFSSGGSPDHLVGIPSLLC